MGNNTSKEESIQSIFDMFQTLLNHENEFRIKIPIALITEYINILLHIYNIYKVNVNVRYTINNGEAGIFKETCSPNGHITMEYISSPDKVHEIIVFMSYYEYNNAREVLIKHFAK